MKVAHLADLHLGFRQYHRQTQLGINQREADVAAAFRRVIESVIEQRPDVVLVAGDVFHSVRPTNAAILDSFNRMRELRVALPGAPVVMIAGDHDTPRSVETGSILKLFEAIEGFRVVTREARRLVFETLDLAVLCVPHAAHAACGRPPLSPERGFGTNILLTHACVAGAVADEGITHDYGGVVLEPSELQTDRWDYVALGHYHVAQPVAANAWYAGAIEYASRNPWGEQLDEEALGRKGRKGWLLVEIGNGLRVQLQAIELARTLVDLPRINGAGLDAPRIDELITANAESILGGIDHQVVRQVVTDVPRLVARELDQERVREYRARALHYHLDVRRPPPQRTVGAGAPGTRRGLSQIVVDYLRERSVSPGVDKERLVTLGRKYMAKVDAQGGDQE